MMAKLIEDGIINMAELSKQNGKSEVENLKAIALFLIAKIEFSGETERLRLTFKDIKK